MKIFSLLLVTFIIALVITLIRKNKSRNETKLAGKMEDFKIEKPTEWWQKELNKGSDFYTQEAIDESNQLIQAFLVHLDIAQNDTMIWLAIENVVIGFNNANTKYDYFIETMEREDLAEYIQRSALYAGLVYKGDVTEEWRTEW